MIASRACSTWLPASSKGYVPSVAATAQLRDFLAMAYKPKTDDSAKPDPRDGLLPLFLVEHEGKEERFYSEKERQDYFAAHNLQVDVETELESAGQARTAYRARCRWRSFAEPLPPIVVASARSSCTRSRC